MVRYSRLVVGRDRDEVAQRLIDSALSGDLGGVRECLESDAGVDVNYIGTVSLRVKCIESVVAEEEEADELEIGYRDFVTDVTPLFAAAHSGHLDIARKLLSAGADVNQELFRGFATTAAARQGHCEILDMLLKAAASKSACEHALLEACLCDQANAAQLLICSEMTGPDAPVAQHALVLATCRGYLEVASTLIQNGVDKNCVNRVLLRSAKPALHANVDCTPLVAAIVSRQMNMVKYLLEVGAKTDTLIRLGAWSWDVFSGEELRVGACLGEPYNEAWCAVEYYEASGEILRLLLEHQAYFLKSQVQGRTLLCHAILCQNPDAVSVLLESGADIEFPIRTEKGNESRPIHLSARVGCLPILKRLILHRCDIDSRTESGDTALMVAAKFDQPECFLELVTAGADLGLVNDNGESAVQLAKRSVFGSSLSDILSQAIMIKESNIKSSDLEVFSVLHFAAAVGNVQIMEVVLKSLIPTDMIINKHDGSGLTPILVAAKSAHTDVFRILIESGAHVSLKSRDGQTLSFILKQHSSSSVQTRFEEILLDSLLSQTVASPTDFRALHFAARVGNSEAVTQLLILGFPINGLDDENGYSPLMVAAKEGNAECCKVLLQNGADFTMLNDRGETALSIAKKNSKCKSAEEAIFDHMARDHVVTGEEIWKHTREGRGPPHLKVVKMLKSGVLTWGKATRRNVVCKEAVAGPSLSFSKNIRKKKNFSNGDNEVFRVVTETGREVHFEVTSYEKMLLWVRGIGLVSKEANNFGDWLPNSLVESKI